MWEDHVGKGTGEGERSNVYQLATIELVSQHALVGGSRNP